MSEDIKEEIKEQIDEEELKDLKEDELKEDINDAVDEELEKQHVQDIKFGKDNAVITTLKQSVGPWLFNTVCATQDAISVAWMAAAYKGTSYSGAISSILFVKTLLLNICSFFSNGITIQLAAILTEHNTEKAQQFLVDVLRVGIIISCCVLIIFAAAGKQILKLISIPDAYLQMDYEYMLVCACTLPFWSFFDNLCSALQGEGRATLASIAQVAAMLITVLITDPIFMMACHVPLWACGFSVNFGAIVVGIVLVTLFARGTFTTKLNFRLFIKPFTPETLTALKCGVLPFCQYLFGLFPTMIMQATITKSAESTGLATQTSSIFGMGLKVYLIVITSSTGALSGLLGPATWAYHKKLYTRIKKIVFSSWILGLLPMVIFVPLMIAKSSVLLKVFITNQTALEIGNRILPPMWYTVYLYVFMQSLNYTVMATVKSIFSITPLILKAIILIVGSLVMGNTLKNTEDMVYILIPGDVVGFIAAIICFRILAKDIWNGTDISAENVDNAEVFESV